MDSITTTNSKSRIGGKAHDRNPTPHTVRVTTATAGMVSSRAHEVSDPLQPVTAVEGISVTLSPIICTNNNYYYDDDCTGIIIGK